MKRLSRILFTFTTSVSLLLCLTAAVLWVRSYWVCDAFEYVTAQGYGYLFSARGRVFLLHQPTVSFWPGGFEIQRYQAGDVPDEEDLRLPGQDLEMLGVRHGHYFTSMANHSWYWVAPWWLAVVLFAILPMLWLPWRVRRARRQRKGLCPTCGYDLRATPDRCPECGAIAAAA